MWRGFDDEECGYVDAEEDKETCVRTRFFSIFPLKCTA